MNLTEVVRTELLKNRREPDGLLHASSHLVGSLRHVQLELAGAPIIERPFAQEMPLYIGTYLHEMLGRGLRGQPVMLEVDLTPWLPEGWGGTADAFRFNSDTRRFRLFDAKSMKGEGFRYLDGPKLEHLWQTSLYYWGGAHMGLDMESEITMLYIPKNDTKDHPEPVTVEFEPLPHATVIAEADRRRARVDEYVASLTPLEQTPASRWEGDGSVTLTTLYVTDELEPVQERVQKLYFDKPTETWDLKLVPHWSTAYCPFDDELCDCRTQGTTKIGMFDTDGETYIPRSGFEEVEPEVFPT